MDFESFKATVSGWLPQIKRISMYHFGDSSAANYKEDLSPVTIADRAIEEYIVSDIKSSFPFHSIMGEESGGHMVEGGDYCWIIDPIDGTRGFVHGVPLFSSLIALTYRGEPLFGAIYLPATGDIVFGDGKQTTVNGQISTMRRCGSVEDATILSSSIANIYHLRDGERFGELMTQCRCFRTWGDGFGYYLLVSGRADVMVDAKMAVWDFMPLIPIIKGAGGVITDYYGGDPTKGNSTVAACPELHHQIIERL